MMVDVYCLLPKVAGIVVAICLGVYLILPIYQDPTVYESQEIGLDVADNPRKSQLSQEIGLDVADNTRRFKISQKSELYVADYPVHFERVLNSSHVASKNMKTILWYDTHGKSMVNGTTRTKFDHCKFDQCQYKHFFTRDDPHFKKPFDVDAVIVQSAAIFVNSPPPRRDENQVFILAVRDTFPRTYKINASDIGMKWLSIFNWTMTFRLDSDIVLKYASIIEREDKSALVHKDYDSIFKEKEHSAVWFVSDCNTRSQREEYVKEIRKVFNVNIYGRCGETPPCQKGDNSCYEELALKHKFYFSFENTFYEHYVTEKVFNWYNKDIVLVVRGGWDYSRIVPNGTVIDAADFKSGVELGNYLNEFGNDKNKNIELLKQKDNYYSIHKLEEYHDANCKLCEYLHNLDAHRKSYKNVAKWWLKNWRNGTPDQLFKTNDVFS